MLLIAEEAATPDSSLAAIAHTHPGKSRAVTMTSSTASSGCLVDAGLMLGQSCRVGWAPNGTLFIPGTFQETYAQLQELGSDASCSPVAMLF